MMPWIGMTLQLTLADREMPSESFAFFDALHEYIY